MEIINLNQLDLNGSYTYADYVLWKFKERVELLKGKIFEMSPAPSRKHQNVSFRLGGEFYNFFAGKSCEVFQAPFDVRLFDKKGNTDTVVQPDLCVVCDPSKLDDKGCKGAPDLVVEILSPGNLKKELKNKYRLYEEAGVLEYWMIDPMEEVVYVYVLENGVYKGMKPNLEEEYITSKLFPTLKIPVQKIFENSFEK